MRKGYSIPQRLAATVLGRMMGAEAAADTLGMDRRTVRGWLSKAAEPDDAEAWTAAQQLAQQQPTERLAAGKVTNPVTLATIAGIASRNVRYSKLIAQREARKAGEAEAVPLTDPSQEQVDRLDWSRRNLLAAEIDAELRARADGGEPSPAGPTDDAAALAWLTAQVDRLVAMSDEEVEERKQALFDEERAEQEAWLDAQREPRAEPIEPEPPLRVVEPPQAADKAVERRVPAVVDVYDEFGPSAAWRPWD